MGKRGPKKQPGIREANGQLSRRQEAAAARAIDRQDRGERDVLSVGIAARARVHGVDLDAAQDQRAGSVIGRLCMAGGISQAQYDAATRWIEDSEAYSRAMMTPRQPGAVDLNATKGGNGYDNVASAQRAYAKHEAALRVVQAGQNKLRGNAALMAALYYVVQRDQHVVHLFGDAGTALGILADHYGLNPQSVAA